jgi:glycosyltransferase involved in cell wall biosynthesis
MTGKKKVLILCESNLNRAPRVRAEYEALREHYDLLLCGYEAPPYADVTYIPIQRDKKEPITFHYELPWIFRKPISALLKAKEQLQRISQHRISKKYYPIIHHPEFKNISLVLNHHAGSLPITLKLIKKLKVPFICNLHEFYPGVADEKMTHLKEWMSYEAQLCQELLPKASAVFTVCEGIRQEYLRTFKVDSMVIRNDKPYDARNPVYWSEGEPLRIIHHGAALRARQLEQMIAAVDQLGANYTMDFMLVASDEDYYNHLKQLAHGKKNIRFIDPVAPDKIVDTLRHYHVGLYSLTPGSINHKLALPNKIFEYVQAKVCIVCSPNQEIKRLVTEHEVGYILPGWAEEDMIAALKNLTPERVNKAKDKAYASAFALSSESTNSLILRTVQQVLNA